MTEGDEYTFDLFFAERHTTASSFRMDTSIELRQEDGVIPEPGTFAIWSLLGLTCALGTWRKRKQR